MDFLHFKNTISFLKRATLGGEKEQFKMAPELRKRFDISKVKNPKTAGVLMLFYPDVKGKTHFLLTLRASYKGVHTNQISFPGGKKEESDITTLDTALRETEEEVGVARESVQVFKSMSSVYIPPSNFNVYPFLGYTPFYPTFIKNYEVESLIHIPVSKLLSEESIASKQLTTSYAKNIVVPTFVFNEHIVWGATAMILSEVKALLKEDITSSTPFQ